MPRTTRCISWPIFECLKANASILPTHNKYRNITNRGRSENYKLLNNATTTTTGVIAVNDIHQCALALIKYLCFCCPRAEHFKCSHLQIKGKGGDNNVRHTGSVADTVSATLCRQILATRLIAKMTKTEMKENSGKDKVKESKATPS